MYVYTCVGVYTHVSSGVCHHVLSPRTPCIGCVEGGPSLPLRRNLHGRCELIIRPCGLTIRTWEGGVEGGVGGRGVNGGVKGSVTYEVWTEARVDHPERNLHGREVWKKVCTHD